MTDIRITGTAVDVTGKEFTTKAGDPFRFTEVRVFTGRDVAVLRYGSSVPPHLIPRSGEAVDVCVSATVYSGRLSLDVVDKWSPAPALSSPSPSGPQAVKAS